MFTLTKFRAYLLRRIFTRLFVQGYAEQNLIKVHGLIRDILEERFTESNHPTLEGFSTDCHNKAWQYR